jgi:hypothetical protein
LAWLGLAWPGLFNLTLSLSFLLHAIPSHAISNRTFIPFLPKIQKLHLAKHPCHICFIHHKNNLNNQKSIQNINLTISLTTHWPSPAVHTIPACKWLDTSRFSYLLTSFPSLSFLAIHIQILAHVNSIASHSYYSS